MVRLNLLWGKLQQLLRRPCFFFCFPLPLLWKTRKKAVTADTTHAILLGRESVEQRCTVFPYAGRLFLQHVFLTRQLCATPDRALYLRRLVPRPRGGNARVSGQRHGEAECWRTGRRRQAGPPTDDCPRGRTPPVKRYNTVRCVRRA
ncbi:hypothetical protein TraAM80_02770 [Trypanosoma rangeli]|uniref:Uncharacterized protein n=1 Tax=Trypanosoma rangeli TaxID=5698 RepID=A0A3R7M3V1_TRYRA|nr:uncharacterized protein TraAM80_02770 [Trypanosoma rangeli]RNF08533.1 hypothetical protein TraAM80_02770 [Trypanosoma rangeli]|eukprot:RNF08533.1 hypothetical protein TraAM80_02770 [Trypanosoma rangeli]